MTDETVELEFGVCKGCGSPAIKLIAVGGSDDGQNLKACLDPDHFIEIAASLLAWGYLIDEVTPTHKLGQKIRERVPTLMAEFRKLPIKRRHP